MKTLVLGATGATGKQLVDQLVQGGEAVKVIIRPSSSPPSEWSTEERVEIIRANVSELSIEEMADHIKDCDAVACCLGHNLNFKGIYGKPRKIGRRCNALKLRGHREEFTFQADQSSVDEHRGEPKQGLG